MKKLTILIMSFVLVLALAACEQKTGETKTDGSGKEAEGTVSGEAYITVNGVPVTKERFDTAFSMYKNIMAAQYQLETKVRDTLIRESVLMEDIKKNNIEVGKDRIEADYNATVTKSGTKEEHAEMLKKFGITEEEDRENIRLSTHFAVHREWFDKTFPVDEKSIKEYYEKNKGEFDSVVASHILVETEKEAKAVKERLAKGEDFGAIAKEVSKDPGSAQNNGSLGEAPIASYVPEFAAACETQEIGVVGEPVKSQFGYHIIRVDERKTGVENHKEAISNALSNESYKTYVQNLIDNAEIK